MNPNQGQMQGQQMVQGPPVDRERIYAWINELTNPETRENALLELSKTRPFEYLRLTSLGVIGALVKTDEQEVINFLLNTEIIPLCLRIMESGSELSKTLLTVVNEQ
nr:hypothetical protein BaRGS_029424 [Batillaria attramentaria]